MKVYDLGFEILKEVLKDKVAFATATKNHARQIKNDVKVLVSSLCGLFLRNYQTITTISEYTFKNKAVEPLIYIGLVFMNNSYKKSLPLDESIKYLASKLELYQVKFDEEVRKDFEFAITNKKEYLSKVLENNGLRHLATKCNIPEWVIKMLFRQYDKEIAKKTINNVVKMPEQYAVRNNRLIGGHEEELNKRFSLVKDNLFKFNDTTSIRKDQLVRVSAVLPIQKAEYQAVSYLPDLTDSDILIYFEDKNSLYVELMNKYLDKNRLNIYTNAPANNRDLFTILKPKNHENLRIVECPEHEIIAHLSEEQDIVFFMPKSSNLELLRRTPEYGINFDTSELDSIIANEYNELMDIARHVKSEGYLVYAVPTFNIKETLVMTKKFLGNVKNFKLVKESTHFPYEAENSIFYVAVFKKDREWLTYTIIN